MVISVKITYYAERAVLWVIHISFKSRVKYRIRSSKSVLSGCCNVVVVAKPINASLEVTKAAEISL